MNWTAYIDRRITIDEKVLERFACDRCAHATDFGCADVKLDFAGVVDEHAVAAVGYIERDAFIGLLGACAAVSVPDCNPLACHSA